MFDPLLNPDRNILIAVIYFLMFVLLGCSVEETSNKKSSESTSGQSVNSTKSKDTLQSQKLEEKVSSQNFEKLLEVKFHREESFGSTSKLIVGKVASIAVDERDRVFIADIDNTQIHVFEPEGKYITSFGRQGSGPAEFEAVTPQTSMTVSSDKLYITDYVGARNFFPSRAQIFDLEDLSFIRTMKLIPTNRKDYSKLQGHFPNRIFPRENGNYLVSFRKQPHDYKEATSYIRYYILDGNGTIVNGPILVQKNLRNLTHYVKDVPTPYTAVTSFAFFEKSLLAVSEKDSLFTARSMEFKINVMGPDGNQARIFQHPFNNVPFNRKGVLEHYRKKDLSYLGDGVALSMIREAENLPSQWPALSKMFFDDKNRLWIATIVENFDVYQWWILKKSGEVITKFEWPRDKPIKTVKNGYLYTQEKNDKSVSSIVKYKINMSGK